MSNSYDTSNVKLGMILDFEHFYKVGKYAHMRAVSCVFDCIWCVLLCTRLNNNI